MREIKFRGYAVDEMTKNQWIHGYGVYPIEFSEDYAKKVGRKGDVYLYTENGEFKVFEKSIGQYTGLKDRNGVEIYEGSELDGAYEVIFKYLKYGLRHISNNDIIDLYDYWRGKNGEVEVTREYTKV